MFCTQGYLVVLSLLAVGLGSSIGLADNALLLDDMSRMRKEYDYVVIGGGTSGLTVANRLTENPRISVLVIEYGYVDNQDPGVLVPGVAVPKSYSRNYQSVPQAGLGGRTSDVYTAAVVGGGTVVNGMFFNRGSAEDYDAWEKLGNPGWGWNDLLPYFMKSETFTPAPSYLTEKYPISNDLSPHGTTGPVGSSFSNYQYPIMTYFFRGWNAIGLLSNPQSNAGDATGAFYSTVSLTAKNQSRSSASAAYYRPIANIRRNFHLITGQTVTKINLNGRNMQATSVNFVTRNSSIQNTIKARREIIVAAGAPHTPQILQLSGIGPKKLLADLGIQVLVDSPGVGYNFQDQVSMFMTFNYSNYPFPSPDWFFSNVTWVAKELALYYETRQGPLTIPYLSGSIVAFLPLQNVTSNYAALIQSAGEIDPALFLPEDADSSIFNGYKAQRELVLAQYASTKSTVQEVAFGGGNTVPIAMLKPLSRGTILINSTDPCAAPLFDYKTFAHPTDLELAVQALKKTRQWMASDPMQEVGAVEVFPGVDVQGDDAIAASIRTFASSTWAHPVGTAAMMPRDLGGVVDPQLRVYGVKGLRIVDASIMPIIPATHTSSTVYAVAEKAADLIKAAQYQHWWDRAR